MSAILKAIAALFQHTDSCQGRYRPSDRGDRDSFTAERGPDQRRSGACRKTTLISVVCAGTMFSASSASADTYATFAAQGTFVDGAVLGGTFTVDETSGLPSVADLTVSAFEQPFDKIVGRSQIFDCGTYYWTSVEQDTTDDVPSRNSLIIPTPNATYGSALVGYMGGDLSSDANCCYSKGAQTQYIVFGMYDRDLLKGSLSPVGSAPEPSDWALMILGFCLTGVALRRARNTTSVGGRRVRKLQTL